MLDSLLKDYWAQGAEDPDLAQQIVTDALDDPPGELALAVRCLQIMRHHPLPDAWRARIETQFVPHVETLIVRAGQVDALGDGATEPHALFEVLGADAEHLSLGSFDADALRDARVGAPDRPHAARDLLAALPDGSLPDSLRSELGSAADDLCDRTRFAAQALLVDREQRGFVLGLSLNVTDAPDVVAVDDVDAAMAKQARVALGEALDGRGGRWEIEWPLGFEGESIGLGLVVAALAATRRIARDPLLAASGRVEVGGAVRGVDGITAKVRAAHEAGIRRVVLAEADRREAEQAAAELDGLDLLFVEQVSEVRPALARASAHAELGFRGRVNLARALLPAYGLALSGEKAVQSGYRLEVSDLTGKAIITLYEGAKASVVVSGKDGATKAAAERLKAEHLQAARPETRPNESYKVTTEALRTRVRDALVESAAAEQEPREFEQWRYKLTDGASAATLAMFTSGTLVLQGNAPAWERARLVIGRALEGLGGAEALLKPAPAQQARNRRAELDGQPWIGTDESGKGDFFGPLVSAAVFCDEATARRLQDLGVTDSKKLTDKRVRELAEQIRRATRYSKTTSVNPPRFNTLDVEIRARGGNTNTMLAWGHARSIETLVQNGAPAAFAVVDQFADSKTLKVELLRETQQRDLEIVLYPRAESDVAVAAASILARDAFLRWIEEASRELEVAVPKGASSPQVIEVGSRLAAHGGRELLGRYAKLSFKTTDKLSPAV